MNLPEFDIDIQHGREEIIFVIMSDTLLEMPPVWRWVSHMLHQEVRYWILRNLDQARDMARQVVSYHLLVLMQEDILWQWDDGSWHFWEKGFPSRLDIMIRQSRETCEFMARIEERFHGSKQT